jgi:hypothetical protein
MSIDEKMKALKDEAILQQKQEENRRLDEIQNQRAAAEKQQRDVEDTHEAKQNLFGNVNRAAAAYTELEADPRYFEISGTNESKEFKIARPQTKGSIYCSEMKKALMVVRNNGTTQLQNKVYGFRVDDDNNFLFKCGTEPEISSEDLAADFIRQLVFNFKS